jgi:hypothetical protein
VDVGATDGAAVLGASDGSDVVGKAVGTSDAGALVGPFAGTKVDIVVGPSIISVGVAVFAIGNIDIDGVGLTDSSSVQKAFCLLDFPVAELLPTFFLVLIDKPLLCFFVLFPIKLHPFAFLSYVRPPPLPPTILEEDDDDADVGPRSKIFALLPDESCFCCCCFSMLLSNIP